MNNYTQTLTFEKAIIKAQKWCVYRERSEAEMDRKLREWRVSTNDRDRVLDILIESDFISNERFAMVYSRGKFKLKSWGKIKIRQGLKFHKINDELIKKSFQQIDSEEYMEELKKIIIKKIPENWEKWDRNEQYKLKSNVFNHAAQKGYESDNIILILNSIFNI